ncbi:IPTL-CTERM sorting domain-containing protein [Ottowia thiooxydans]|uniref:IPTL-CTERM sorting domain-containing protein n=1 Tax=Ottowia thiooxydans TaxID=219182 RepID=UPI0004904D3A|nr:IPTL-CTERM sorting domain-containing protein [Ottowia thiooxydans]
MRYSEAPSTATNTPPTTALELATVPATGDVTLSTIWNGATAPTPSQWDGSAAAGATVAAGMGKDGYIYAMRAVGTQEGWTYPGTWGPPGNAWQTHSRRYEMLRYGRSGVDNLGIVSGLGTYRTVANNPATQVNGVVDNRIGVNFNAADIHPITGVMYLASFQSGGFLNRLYLIDVTQTPPQYLSTLNLDANIPGAQSGDFAIDAAGEYAYGVAKATGFLGTSTSYRIRLSDGHVESLTANLGIFPFGAAARLPNDPTKMAFYGAFTQVMNLPAGTLGAIQNTAFSDSADAASCLPKLKATLQCTPLSLFDADANVSTCTVTLDQPAPVGGIDVALTPPASNPRYSTTCGTSIAVPAGQATAQCTITATPNTVPADGNVTADIALAAPAATADYELGTPTSAAVLVQNDDALLASVICTPTDLVDSAGNVSTCTISLNGPAPEGGIMLNLSPPGANPRYTTDCGSSAQIAAGASQTQCTITATPNTTPGDGDVQAPLALLAGNGYSLGSPNAAIVNVKNDDQPVVPPSRDRVEPVPTLGEWAMFFLSLCMVGLARRRNFLR